MTMRSDSVFSRHLERELVAARNEVVRLKGEAESWEKVFDRTCEHLAEAREQRDKAVFALQGLLEDIIDYQTINNLVGENNHWQVIAKAVLKECGK